uniref:Auxin responsive protein n=2 Tax=Oryza TaxID=4527 RepID=A0A0E0N2Z4_ORYRU
MASASSQFSLPKHTLPGSITRAAAGHSSGVVAEMKAGYVPVLVGKSGGGGGEAATRFLVPVGLLNDPCMEALLELAADEMGYGQEGVLSIPCDADFFRRVVTAIPSANKANLICSPNSQTDC